MGSISGGGSILKVFQYMRIVTTLDTRLDLHVAQVAKYDCLAPMEDENN